VEERRKTPLLGMLLHAWLVVTGAGLLTLAFFLILPLIQAIAKAPSADLVLQSMDTASLPPPPPPPPEQEIEEEPEEEPEPPELLEESQTLDLAQLELALNPGFGDGWLGGDFAVKLNTGADVAGEVDALFSLADLDQKPRVIYQPGPMLNAKVRKRAPGTVYVLFVVNHQGRVEDPVVQNATDPVFERPAVDAVRKWKFEPGLRDGEPVRFRMRVPITFPKG